MKKWEEERKKKQYAQKINQAKPTLKTQPKGSKASRQGTLSSSNHFQGISKYSNQNDYHEQQSLHPSRGQAEFYGDANQYLAMGSPGDASVFDQPLLHSDPIFNQGMGSGANTGPFSNMDAFSKQASPGMSLENNLNYKHVKGMNATNFNQHSSAMNLPRESGGMQSVIAGSGGTTGS